MRGAWPVSLVVEVAESAVRDRPHGGPDEHRVDPHAGVVPFDRSPPDG